MADAAAKPQGNISGMVILIVLMVLIIYFMSSLSYSDQKAMLNVSQETRELVNTAPGKLPVTNLYRYKHDLPKVALNNLPTKKEELLYSKIDITKKWLASDFAKTSFNLPAGFMSGKLTFFVVDGADAQLKVLLNNQVIHQEVMSSTKQAAIELPKNILLPENNVLQIKIKASGGKFWKTYTYTLSDVKLVLQIHASEIKSVTQKVSLPSSEASGLQAATLTSLLKQLSKTAAKFSVKVNDVVVYTSNTGETQSLEIGLPVGVLKAGMNDITWEIDGLAEYQLPFAKLTTFSLNKPAKTYEFYIYSGDEERLALGLMSCDLILQRESGDDTVMVQINNQLLTYEFDDDEIVDNTICSYLRGKSNSVSLFSDESVTLSKLKVLLRVK